MDRIEELLTRGVTNVIPGKNELKKRLASDKKLNIYLGVDPTATKIHLGHAVVLRKLNEFSKLGHNVTFLIGDFTALIGDTSDKDTERPVLTSEEIKENFKTYKEQAEKILDFSKVNIKYNSEWLSNLRFEEIVKLCQQFSLNDFIGRELIKKRLDEGKKVALHEVLYPVMQGYDSYFMDMDLQVGGADQTFNMQAGRTLQKKLRNKDAFVLTTEYLMGIDGRKMSKSWGNAIWLDDNPDDMFAKIMAIDDKLIDQYFTLATNENPENVKKIKEGKNPMDIKKELAKIIVTELHSGNDALSAEVNFENTVQAKEIPKHIPIEIVPGGITASEVLIRTNMASSMSDAKRLIEQGGVKLNNKKILDPKSKIEEGPLSVGKRRFVKIKIK